MNKASVFDFENYSKFIQIYLNSQPKRGWGLSVQWSKQLRMSPTLLSQVIQGKKHFTFEQAFEMSQILNLSQTESQFFILLVQRQKAGTEKYKKYLTVEIEKLRDLRSQVKSHVSADRVLTEIEKVTYYSSWIFAAVRNFCSIGNGKTIQEISTRFSLKLNRANKVIDFLLETNLCHLNSENRFAKSNTIITLERSSPHIIKHHTHWRLKAIEKIETLSDEEVMLTIPLSIGRSEFSEIRAEIMNLFKLSIEKIKNSEPQDVACFNIDLFWLDKP